MARNIITNNDIGTIPTIPIFVGFTVNDQERPFTDAEMNNIITKVFESSDSLNAYYREISYHQLELAQEGRWDMVLEHPPDHYSWGFVPGEFDSSKPKMLVSDVFQILLDGNLETQFQDRLILVFINTSAPEIGGRGAMCLAPGTTDYPHTTPPSTPEFFVGHPPLTGPQFDTSRRIASFIDENFTVVQYGTYRKSEFSNWNDQFVRGVCIFTRDTARSCAAHDILHAVKRISGEPATRDFPGRRARAVPCLYNLYQQGYWITNQFRRSIYCAPYVGWWDNMGDHLHPQLPRDFFAGAPYGVCAFTKMKLDMIPPSYIGTATAAQQPFRLVPLTVSALPQQSSGQPVLAVKVPLSEGKDTTEYLLVEYRRYISGTVDGIRVDVCGLVGNCNDDPAKVNPPDSLVSDKGILVYHVNEEKSQFGGEPRDYDNTTTDPDFVQDFLIYLYTPSMITETGALDWSKRTPEALKAAGFKPGPGTGYVPTFRLLYPFVNPTMRIEITVTEISDNDIDIEVMRTTL